MNDPSAQPPDWGAVFSRARRRIIGRLLVVGVLAATGTALLLGGGLSAQGAVSLRIIGNESDAKKDTTQEKPAKKPKERKGTAKDTGGSGNKGGKEKGHNGKQSKPDKQDKPEKHQQWNPCSGTSAGAQYCDSPEEVDGGESTTTPDATVQP